MDSSRSRKRVPATVVVQLNCMHTLIFRHAPPRKNEHVYCLKCEGVRTVIVSAVEWSFRCKKCGYTRRFGEAELSAKTFATKHSIKHRHAVNIFHGTKLIETVGGHNEKQLELLYDEPPF